METLLHNLKQESFWKELEIVNDRPTLESMRALLEKFHLPAPRNGSACIQLLWSNKEIISPPPPPLQDQCENGLRAEAEERLKTCLESSFRTDNGRIMLENDLMLFDVDAKEEWLKEVLSEWLPRLKSTFHDEFILAINLWVLSQ
jgi:hypothetical protein